MVNEINNLRTKNTIILNEDSIVIANNSKKALITFLRGLVAQYLEIHGSILKTKFMKNYFDDEKLTLTTYSEQFNIWVRGEPIDFDFNDFKNWVLENKISKNLIIDKRTKHFANSELSNKFQKVSPDVVVDSETNTQESNVASDLNDQYIHSLKILLKKLSNVDFLCVFNSALALPIWRLDNKFSAIYKDELQRRHSFSQDKPENVTKLELVSK